VTLAQGKKTADDYRHAANVTAYGGVIRAVCNGCGWTEEATTAAEARRLGGEHERSAGR
jgi:hypothetical protein